MGSVKPMRSDASWSKYFQWQSTSRPTPNQIFKNSFISRKLLGQEKHYDWGLRALKSVLNGCRGILRRNVEAKIEADSELRLVVKALLLDTASKLTYSDRIKFDSLIGDVFPESKFESSENNDLVKALEESYLEFGLQSNKRQVGPRRAYKINTFSKSGFSCRSVWSCTSSSSREWAWL